MSDIENDDVDFEETGFSNNVGDIITHAVDGNPSAIGDVVDSILKTKATDYINNMKDDVSKNFFGSGEINDGEDQE